MAYYLGVDGGGTKTEALLTDEEGYIIARGKSGASNPNFVGEKLAVQAISKAIKHVVKSIDLKEIKKTALCIASYKVVKDKIIKQFSLRKEDVIYTSDIKNTFYGALLNDTGIVVLSGTGSFALGINEAGEEFVVGGWGPIIGDPGSGHWMGVKALQAAVLDFDSMGPETSLTDLICKKYNFESLQQLKSSLTLDMVSQLAPLVKDAAETGDYISQLIIKDAAKQLAKMAQAVINHLEMDNNSYDLTLTGGISNFGKVLWQPFVKEIKENSSQINVIKPGASPVVGSVLMSMKEDTKELSSEIINNLIKSYREAAK